jgi:mRNA interferase MazF
LGGWYLEGMIEIKRGDIYKVRFSNDFVGHEQGGTRPALVIQNNKGNQCASRMDNFDKRGTLIVALLTASNGKTKIPTHLEINQSNLKEGYIKYPSLVLFEQLKTIDPQRIMWKMGTLNDETMLEVDKKIIFSLGVNAIPMNDIINMMKIERGYEKWLNFVKNVSRKFFL